MSNSWDERKKAQEEEYFLRLNSQAMERIKEKNEAVTKPRLSPITGEPLEQVALMGVVIDRCKKSGGIWLDAGELEQILEFAKKSQAENSSWLNKFVSALSGKQ